MNPTRNRLLQLIAAVAAVGLLAAACGSDDDDDPAQEAGDGLSGQTIDVGVGIDTSYAPFFVADAEGYFEEEGLSVNIRQFERGGLAVDALAAGEVHFAGSSGITTMTQFQQDPEMEAILIYEESGEYVKTVLRDGVDDPSEIERVGIVAGLSEYGAIQYLESQGIDPAEVELIDGGPPEVKDVLVRGDIDAFVMWEPWPQQAIDEGNANVVARSGDFGFVYHHWLVTNGTWAEENPADAAAFARALARGAELVEADPERTAEILDEAIAAAREDVLVAIEEVDFGVRGFEESDFDRYDSYQDFWLSGGQIPELDWRAGVNAEWFAEHGG